MLLSGFMSSILSSILPTLAILMRFIKFCFHIIRYYCVILCCYWKKFRFSQQNNSVRKPCMITIILLACFSRQSQLVVFKRSQRDSKSPQVYMTLLSVLADPNNTTVLMVSLLSLMVSTFSPFSKLLGTVLSAPSGIGITATPMFHSFFVPLQHASVYLSFRFLLFSLRSLQICQNPLYGQLFFVDNYYKMFSGRE